jgi:hypothetical protein
MRWTRQQGQVRWRGRRTPGAWIGGGAWCTSNQRTKLTLLKGGESDGRGMNEGHNIAVAGGGR